MKIKGDTELFVVGREGVSALTLSEVANAFRGGMSAADVTICTDRAEAEALAGQDKALTELCAAVTDLTPEQRTLVKEFVQTLKEGHAAACQDDDRSTGQ